MSIFRSRTKVLSDKTRLENKRMITFEGIRSGNWPLNFVQNPPQEYFTLPWKILLRIPYLL